MKNRMKERDIQANVAWDNLGVFGPSWSKKVQHILCSVIDSTVKSGSTLCIYDKDFPTLTRQLEKSAGQLPESRLEGFVPYQIIDLTDVGNSIRINPIRPDCINGLKDAEVIATLLRQSLISTYTFEEGERVSRFEKSGITLLTAAIDYFVTHHPKMADLPHVILFLMQDLKEVLAILCRDSVLNELTSIFQIRLEHKAYNELTAILSETLVGLGRSCDPEAFWVLSGEHGLLSSKTQTDLHHQRLVIANHTGLYNPATLYWQCFLLGYITDRLCRSAHPEAGKQTVMIGGMDNLFVPGLKKALADNRHNVQFVLNASRKEYIERNYGCLDMQTWEADGREVKALPAEMAKRKTGSSGVGGDIPNESCLKDKARDNYDRILNDIRQLMSQTGL